jgi:type VI secretion system protein ImpJ
MASSPGPTTRARSLCRVHWQLGQALLPEHFERQELGLSRELELRFAQLAPAAWGIAQIGLDDDALAGGIVRLTRLVAVLPRGRVVDVPGNARGTPFDLSTADAHSVGLYLHLLAEPGHEKDDERARDLEAVELIVDRVELSTAPGHPGAVDSLKLAQITQDPDGVWTIRAGYVPPLLALAAWPAFFARVVGRLRKLLAGWEDVLLGDLESHVLSVAKSLRAHECLRRSRLHGWFLTQIDGDAPARTTGPRHPDSVVAIHPFELYRRLVDLALDVHAYQSAAADAPAPASQVYDHRDIAGCFEPLLAELESRTRLPHGRAPYAPFVRDGRIAACALPEVVETTRLYWLVRRAESVSQDDLRAVKLAACSRLETVHRHALRGIAIKPLASVPFRHDFDPDVELYEIVASGEEWDFSLRERRLGYVAEGAVAACETYLFWRAG